MIVSCGWFLLSVLLCLRNPSLECHPLLVLEVLVVHLVVVLVQQRLLALCCSLPCSASFTSHL